MGECYQSHCSTCSLYCSGQNTGGYCTLEVALAVPVLRRLRCCMLAVTLRYAVGPCTNLAGCIAVCWQNKVRSLAC